MLIVRVSQFGSSQNLGESAGFFEFSESLPYWNLRRGRGFLSCENTAWGAFVLESVVQSALNGNL